MILCRRDTSESNWKSGKWSPRKSPRNRATEITVRCERDGLVRRDNIQGPISFAERAFITSEQAQKYSRLRSLQIKHGKVKVGALNRIHIVPSPYLQDVGNAYKDEEEVRNVATECDEQSAANDNERASRRQPLFIANRRTGSRRATCPDIWLSKAESFSPPVTDVHVNIVGASGVGKTMLIGQLGKCAGLFWDSTDTTGTTWCR